MTADTSKTVFVSYRHDMSLFIAHAIFQNLRQYGYDVFIDMESTNSCTSDTIILNQIAARAHFLVILTFGAVKRCAEPGDWLRREIEQAVDLQRNIVLLLVNEFKFNDQAKKYLTGKLANLPCYNALDVPIHYFDAAMDRLRSRFLRQPMSGTIQFIPTNERAIVQEKIEKVLCQPKPTEQQLMAEQYFNRGYECGEHGDTDGAIANYTKAIHLNPQDASAYHNRGIARYAKSDYDGTIGDCTEAIRLNPQDVNAYIYRGNAYDNQRDFDGAIADYSEAIRLDPQNAVAYNNRGWVHGDTDRAIADYSEAIRLNPQNPQIYINRGRAYRNRGNSGWAIADFTEAIRLNPQDASAYNNRGVTFEKKGDYQEALADYEAAIRLDPNLELAYINRDHLLRKMGRK